MSYKSRISFRERYDALLTKAPHSGRAITEFGIKSRAGTYIIRTPVGEWRGFHAATCYALACQILRQYADKAYQVITRNRPVVPWMKWREIEVINEILTRLRPRRCLEWGSGYSTAYFPRFIPSFAGWMSIEHDESWVSTVRGVTRNPNVTLTHIPPDRYPFTDLYGDGTEDDLRSYVNYPTGKGLFDFILVDGRGRMACVQKAAEILDPQGVMIMHDANREMYAKSSNEFRHQIIFDDHRNDTGGLWICSPGRSLDSVLDIERHGRIWSLCTRIGTTRVGRMMRV